MSWRGYTCSEGAYFLKPYSGNRSNAAKMLLVTHSYTAWAARLRSIRGFWKYEYLGHKPSLNTTCSMCTALAQSIFSVSLSQQRLSTAEP